MTNQQKNYLDDMGKAMDNENSVPMKPITSGEYDDDFAHKDQAQDTK
jgi:hypothetical protein